MVCADIHIYIYTHMYRTSSAICNDFARVIGATQLRSLRDPRILNPAFSPSLVAPLLPLSFSLSRLAGSGI